MVSDMIEKNVYIFAGESYMMKQSLNQLKQSLDIQYPQLNITSYKSMPKADELIEACASVPFMENTRLVVLDDCTVLTAKGGAEEAKKIAAFIDRMPDTTVLALCSDGAPDKRRTLYKKVKKSGIIKEFVAPKSAQCIEFVIECVKKHGSTISRRTAGELVAVVGCDYYALDNETAKLAVYSGFKEIISAHIAACASRSLEYNVFEIHGLFVAKQAGKAQQLLDEILSSERPEALIGIFARKFRDMFKTKAMMEAGFGLDKIATLLSVRNFVAEILMRECKRFSLQELRYGLKALADLDYGIKCGEKDATIALPDVLIKIYKF